MKRGFVVLFVLWIGSLFVVTMSMRQRAYEAGFRDGKAKGVAMVEAAAVRTGNGLWERVDGPDVVPARFRWIVRNTSHVDADKIAAYDYR